MRIICSATRSASASSGSFTAPTVSFACTRFAVLDKRRSAAWLPMLGWSMCACSTVPPPTGRAASAERWAASFLVGLSFVCVCALATFEANIINLSSTQPMIRNFRLSSQQPDTIYSFRNSSAQIFSLARPRAWGLGRTLGRAFCPLPFSSLRSGLNGLITGAPGCPRPLSPESPIPWFYLRLAPRRGTMALLGYPREHMVARETWRQRHMQPNPPRILTLEPELAEPLDYGGSDSGLVFRSCALKRLVASDIRRRRVLLSSTHAT
jgi:hypothetical protein